jgi:hypothetical protein
MKPTPFQKTKSFAAIALILATFAPLHADTLFVDFFPESHEYGEGIFPSVQGVPFGKAAFQDQQAIAPSGAEYDRSAPSAVFFGAAQPHEPEVSTINLGAVAPDRATPHNALSMQVMRTEGTGPIGMNAIIVWQAQGFLNDYDTKKVHPTKLEASVQKSYGGDVTDAELRWVVRSGGGYFLSEETFLVQEGGDLASSNFDSKRGWIPFDPDVDLGAPSAAAGGLPSPEVDAVGLWLTLSRAEAEAKAFSRLDILSFRASAE